jgi:hypothetical protein
MIFRQLQIHRNSQHKETQKLRYLAADLHFINKIKERGQSFRRTEGKLPPRIKSFAEDRKVQVVLKNNGEFCCT